MTARPLELALIGAGPTAASLLERLSANAPELLPDRALRIHLVDPHRAGTGRVWRPDLDRLLWMNSLAEDVTMFPDETVRCEGPPRPGPSLFEWAQGVDDRTLSQLATPDLVAEIRALRATSFPTRLVQSVYLDWFHRHVRSSLPPSVDIVVHAHRAVDVVDADDGRQSIVFDDAEPLCVDAVVLSLGHLDADPDPTGAALVRFAAEHGLVYLPPGHTAEQDLSVLAPGQRVLVLGFGQAFTDLLVLVTEGRGGRFVEHGVGSLVYVPSGHEPLIAVGSRRGVPYRSKLDYRLQAPLAPLPMFLDDTTTEALLGRPGLLDFRRDVFPLLLKDVAWAYYHELFVAHPERTCTTWEEFAVRFAPLPWGGATEALVSETVPAVEDRFEIDRLDRPLHGCRFGSHDELHGFVAAHVRADVARRTDPAFSADLAAFVALVQGFSALSRIAPYLSPRSRVADFGGWWFSFFMYYASGPPPQRLRQLLALADAGLVRFLGADVSVSADGSSGRFVARSSSHDDAIVGDALVDARIATPTVSRTREPLLRTLWERGDVVEEIVGDDSGWTVNTGKVVVTGPDLKTVRRDGSAHPRRHALGVFTNRPAAGALARPRMNAPAFRQNDAVARSILTSLAS